MVTLTDKQREDIYLMFKYSGPTDNWQDCPLRCSLKRISPLTLKSTTFDVVISYLIAQGFIFDDIKNILYAPEEKSNVKGLAQNIEEMIYHAGCQNYDEFAILFNEKVMPEIDKLHLKEKENNDRANDSQTK